MSKVKMNLQFFGGRGSSGGKNSGGGGGGSAQINNSPFERNAKPREIKTEYKSRFSGALAPGYKDEVLEAKSSERGGIVFEYATPETRYKTAKTNKVEYVTYKLSHGAVNGEIFGINLDKVNMVSGQTYNLRSELKKKGFKWDGSRKAWVK